MTDFMLICQFLSKLFNFPELLRSECAISYKKFCPISNNVTNANLSTLINLFPFPDLIEIYHFAINFF